MNYIGYTSEKLIKRITAYTKAESHIGDALRKHELKNFKVKVLWEVDNKKDACIVEKAAICAYKTQVPNGYDLTPGGEGGGAKGCQWNLAKETKKCGEIKIAQILVAIKILCEGLKLRKNLKIKNILKKSILQGRITQRKNRLKKLEQEIFEECFWDDT